MEKKNEKHHRIFARNAALSLEDAFANEVPVEKKEKNTIGFLQEIPLYPWRTLLLTRFRLEKK